MYLYLRRIVLSIFSGLVFFWRKKAFRKDSAEKVLVIALKRVGDTILSIPALRAVKESLPRCQVTVFAGDEVKDILERIPYIDNIITWTPGSSFLQKARQLRRFSRKKFDLAVDFTCDHTLEGALLAFWSGARFRVGYGTSGRGFPFHSSVRHPGHSLHASEEILNIVRAISLDTGDRSPAITASEKASAVIQSFLKENNVGEQDLLVGIHPGGYYPTQRWPASRFAEVADRLIKKHKARIILMGGPKEEKLIAEIKANMTQHPIAFINQCLGNLLALIQTCHVLICNNSGPLHLAAALGTLTVSTMGPTLPERWWPQGEGHIVLRKNLACMPCNEGRCPLNTHECLTLITVEEMTEAAEAQIARLRKGRRDDEAV